MAAGFDLRVARGSRGHRLVTDRFGRARIRPDPVVTDPLKSLVEGTFRDQTALAGMVLIGVRAPPPARRRRGRTARRLRLYTYERPLRSTRFFGHPARQRGPAVVQSSSLR